MANLTAGPDGMDAFPWKSPLLTLFMVRMYERFRADPQGWIAGFSRVTPGPRRGSFSAPSQGAVMEHRWKTPGGVIYGGSAGKQKHLKHG